MSNLKIIIQVEATTDESKKGYKTNKQVKTDVPYETFLDLMIEDLTGKLFLLFFVWLPSLNQILLLLFAAFTKHIIIFYWQKNVTQGRIF